SRPTGAVWLLPETITIWAPAGAVAVAVKTIGLLATPPGSTLPVSVWVPADGPRTQLPTVAMPWALVRRIPPVTCPPPVSTLNDTGAWATRLPKASVTRTLGAGGNADP